MAVGIPPAGPGEYAATSVGAGMTQNRKPATGNNSSNDGSRAQQSSSEVA